MLFTEICLLITLLIPIFILACSAMMGLISVGYTSFGLFLSIVLGSFVIGYIIVFLKRPYKNVERNKKVEKKLFSVCWAITLIMLFLSIEIQDEVNKPYERQERKKWEKQANDAGYYKKNGLWYYMGKGVNDQEEDD